MPIETEIDLPYLILMIIALSVFGAIFGSFTACQARRIRNRELKHKSLSRRSICLHCHHQLKWYDNIPIISWLSLRGRCRYCHKKIGKMELFSELGLALVFITIGLTFFYAVAPQLAETFTLTKAPSCPHSVHYTCATPDVIISYIPDWVTPYEITLLVLFLITVTALWTLLLYDAMWKRLPVKLLTFSIICAIIYRSAYLLPFFLNSEHLSTSTLSDALLSLGEAILILPGVYFALYKVSQERWVGSGDWLLCLALAFLLGTWQLALITLFLANLLGSIIMFPTIKLKKSKSHQIPFGPFLILATITVFTLQTPILEMLSLGY